VVEKISIFCQNSSVEIFLAGGLVNRFTVGTREIIYPQREIKTENGIKKRGGIPILFPNADPITDPSDIFNLGQHGFARDKKWQVEVIEQNRCILSLASDSQTLKQYPFDFKLFLTIEVQKGILLYCLKIINPDKEKTLPVSPGLHPYFNLPVNQRNKFDLDLPGFDSGGFDWNSVLSFPEQKKVKMVFSNGEKIELEVSAQFKYWFVWAQKDLDFVCVEPWVGKRNSLLKEKERLNVLPQKEVELTLKISS